MLRWIVLTMLLVPCVAFAADFWDGNAALQRGDAAFEGGLNVASNSFPPGTQITIQDEDTGKTVTATVTGRIEGQSDILLLMSPKTAEALGVSQGTMGRVRVTVPPPSSSVASANPGDQTASPDPDVNPAAAGAAGAAGAATIAQTPEAAAATAPAAASQTGSTTEQPTGETPATGEAPATAEQPATTGEAPATAEQPAVTGEAPAAAQAAPAASPDDAAILSEAESRSPQKQVFQPPREDQKFVLKETTPTQPATTTPAVTTPAPAGLVASVEEPGLTPPASPQSNLPLADVTAPEESRPEEIVGTGTSAPSASPAPQAALAEPQLAPESQTAVATTPVQTEVTGPQASPPPAGPAPQVALAPPETPGTAKPAGTPPAAASSTTPRQPAVTVASAATVPQKGPGTYYLQLAAYGSEKGARDLAARLAPTYPALVLAPAGAGSQIYKVVIGPLNRAESGTLLTWFRYRGFPDAFLKQE